MISESYLYVQELVLVNMFKWASQLGYDLDQLSELLMTTNYGIDIMEDRSMIEWSDGRFMLEGFEREFNLRKGKTYDDDVLYLAGCLYKYWVSKYEVNPKKVYELAPLSKIEDNYGALHINGFDYMVEALTDRDFDK